MSKKQKTSERTEALMRILVLIVSGIILAIWHALIKILVVIHWFIAIFTNKRNKGIAEFCEIWNTQIYVFFRYMTFVTNERPFPFNGITKDISKFEK